MAVVTADRMHGNPAPIDKDVVIPAAVRRAAEAADKAQREHIGLPEPMPEPAPTSTPPADGIIIAEPPTPAPPPGVTSTVEPAPPLPPAATVPDTGKGDTWENRYKAEHGRYMSQKDLLTAATGRISLLENHIGSMSEQIAQLQAAPPAPAPVPTSLLTDKEREEFGPDMIDVMRRVALEAVAPQLAPIEQLTATTRDLSTRLSGTTQAVNRTAMQDMMAKLDVAMPEWRKVNLMDEFKAWLALPDPYFSLIRKNELLKAWEQNDTPRVLQFFKGFIAELAATDPAIVPQPEPPASAQPTRPDLSSLAAPGRARQSAAPEPPTEKQIITTADIKAFYDRKRSGHYVGREAEFHALEQELFLAQREGRVRQV